MRTARGAGFAGTALGLGVGAHLMGGGALPDLGTMVFLAVPVVWMSFFLTRARRRWPVIVGSLMAVETGLHAGFSLLSGPAGRSAPLPDAGEGHPALGAHAGVIGGPGGGMPSAHGMAEMAVVPNLTMLSAHLLATVLTGLVLAYGEHLLWCLWTWVNHAVTIVPGLVRFPARRAVTPEWLLTVNPVLAPVDRSVRRRGPPRLGPGLPAAS